MKGRSLILIFLFLLFIVHPVVAANVTESFNFTGSLSGSFTTPGTTNILPAVGYVTFGNAQSMKGVKYVTWVVPDTRWHAANPSDDQLWEDVTFSTYGTGEFGYNHVGSNYYMTIVFNDDFDISGLSGTVRIPMTGMSTYYCAEASGLGHASLSPTSDTAVTVCGLDGGFYSTWTADHYFYTSYTFLNTYTYDTVNGLSTMWVDKGTSPSMFNVTGIYDEYPSNTNSLKLKSNQTTWVLDVTDSFGTGYSDTVYFSLPSSSATIEFNQSYFTFPEPVGAKYNIQNLDITNYDYWILLTGTNDGIKYFVTNDYYDITTATGQDNFNISYLPLSLPFTMQAELWQYSKVSGESSVLAYSSEVAYNPASLAPGSIWTQKENYNISEIFYIEFNTNYNSVQIELISASFHDLRTMEGPGTGHLGYLFNEPHNFTAYLIEGGVKTNYVDFTVSADTLFLNIHVNSIPLNQGFCFSYYTDNTSDVITGYRPDGSIFYGPITDLDTLEKIDICGPSSSGPAGTYTMSLMHEGTEYYNDTIEMTSANEYVYFEASKYETGDRMVINYYIMDSRQRIRLSDSIGTAVITWTCDAFYITPNMGNSLWFSLTDNNEYGMNVLTSIDAGSFRTGNWKVEIIDIDGQPLTNESTYDYTTVSREIESPEDATNEFIMILFSPEGLFMIFTACLTMMGLVAAHHPAGGAAGAVVGVGFGVYFSVLPIWMLLLMVIALVVLAGVSVAVYFRGKT